MDCRKGGAQLYLSWADYRQFSAVSQAQDDLPDEASAIEAI